MGRETKCVGCACLGSNEPCDQLNRNRRSHPAQQVEVKNPFLKLYVFKRRKNPRALAINIPCLGQTGSDDTSWFVFRFSLALQMPGFYLHEEVIERPWGIWVKEGV